MTVSDMKLLDIFCNEFVMLLSQCAYYTRKIFLKKSCIIMEVESEQSKVT